MVPTPTETYFVCSFLKEDAHFDGDDFLANFDSDELLVAVVAVDERAVSSGLFWKNLFKGEGVLL